MSGAAQIPSTLDALRRSVADGGCLGGQVFVWRDGRVIADVALGHSTPTRSASPSDQARLYCAVKPLTGCCVARAVEAGDADFDDPVRRYLPEFSTGGRETVTLRQILTHTSRLPDFWYNPSSVHYREIVERVATSDLPPSAWYGEPRYNETVAWNVLAVVLERMYRTDFADVVRQLVLEPADLRDLQIVEPDPARYAPCCTVSDGVFKPVAEPPLAMLPGQTDPAHGGFGTVRDLGRLYAELLSCATGSGRLLGPAVTRELIGGHSNVHLAPGAGWRMMSMGFMTDATKDIGGHWSRQSFGHQGLAIRYRVIYAFADPVHRVAAAIRLFSAGVKNDWRFRRLGAALGEDLEL